MSGTDLSVAVAGTPYSGKVGAFLGFMPDDPTVDKQLYPVTDKLGQGFNVRAEVGWGMWLFGYQYDSFSGKAETRLGDPLGIAIQSHLLLLGMGREIADLGDQFSFYLGCRLKIGYGSISYQDNQARTAEHGVAISTEIYPAVLRDIGSFQLGLGNPISMDALPGTNLTGMFFTLVNPSIVLKYGFQ